MKLKRENWARSRWAGWSKEMRKYNVFLHFFSNIRNLVIINNILGLLINK